MKKYRAKRRLEAIKYLGGICNVCGSSENLEFDHIDRKNKLFNISGFTGSKKNFWNEVDKCQLLCHDHHIEKTAKEIEVNHGTTTMFYRGCRCEDCKITMRQARREYNMVYRGRP